MASKRKRHIPITSYPHNTFAPQEEPTQQTAIEEDGEITEQTTSAPQEEPTQQMDIEAEEIIKKYGTGKPTREIMRARIAYDKGSEGQ